MSKSKLDGRYGEVAAMVRDRASNQQIARAFGVDEASVRRFRKKHGIYRPEPKVLVLDIETRPALAYVWNVWNVNIAPQQIVEDKATISFAAQWHGNTKTMFYSDHHSGHDRMVAAAWQLLDDADVVVHYNGVKFDVPHLNQEFALAGYNPPSDYYQLDLLKSVRRDFAFTSNKLDNIIKQFEIGSKIEHEGFALWVKCLAGDAKAWAKMKEYNIHDVVETGALYDRLLPWVGVVTQPKRYAVNHKKLGALL